ncbi:hypothetical protein GSI82_001539 [Salmonella enterica subsp. enterica serovar Anatum]|nr:hypothetical protein [Salmonella enterica subsp. enterica serovar Anatum]EEG5190485.1 hypothetical protein [Salmonella enterica]EEG5898591.1 hypothetical protein [Salmonella enterica subsp. enterica]EDQ0812213.1 hypothetical protein [Salmonella enterica subsp. enterica serovar Anatum]EDQ1070008.1 hypothetical protein [Salmonella enterica subsp. enterica serovar Anatum]
MVLADNRLKDRLNTGYLITGLYHADWLILGYTTVIIIFGIVCYIGLLKLITKGKHEK